MGLRGTPVALTGEYTVTGFGEKGAGTGGGQTDVVEEAPQ